MDSRTMRVGELAKRTGVSVRTLHYYEEIGLLSPSHRSAAGHRLYAAGDIVRLQAIKSLRQLGFSLNDIRGLLEQPDISPQRVIELHVARLKEQIGLQQRLCRRLEALADGLRSVGEVSTEEFIEAIKEISMFEKYYTPDQLKELDERRQVVGEERIRQVEAEWPALMEQVRAEMEAGTDPASERAQALAQRWMALVREFTGGNPGIEKSLNRMYEQETVIHGMETAPMREMGVYISRAMAASGTPG